VLLPVGSTTGGSGNPARLKSARYSHAIAMKCGICQTKTIAKSAQASGVRAPRAATHPIIGGNAPGTAPTSVASCERRFIGV
jgi:hypothetical protein